jgi:exodeoxyribonuclease-5
LVAIATKPKGISLSNMQRGAVEKAKEWFMKGNNQVFVMTGFAGTGKTTCVEYLIEDLNINLREVAFVSPTGKASLVITQKANGKYEACTIHRLIYNLDGQKGFVLKDERDLKHLKLIICDESSMVSKDLLEDLLSYKIKVLFLGDKGQLEPVGEKTTLLDNPDYELTEIHRQAADNPIIHLSMLAREGKRLNFGKYGNHAYVLNKKELNQAKLLDLSMRADQVICGYNSTRKRINQQIREKLGRTSQLPIVGDKMICLKNSWQDRINDIALVNGMTGFVVNKEESVPKTPEIRRDCMKVSFQPDFSEDKFEDLLLINDDFLTSKPIKLEQDEYQTYNSFDYGYAITAHKSQGSQFDRLLVMNEVLNVESHSRWLYTAITRSTDKLILVM